jgi:hypothetical protein
MEEKFKILSGAIGYDAKTQISHLVVPVPSLVEKKGVWRVINEPYLVNSEYEKWPLTPDEQKARNIFLESQAQFPIGKPYWAAEDINKFVQEKGMPKVDPFTDIFEPICDILDSTIDFHEPTDSLLITAWIIGTYMLPVFDAFPYMFISGTRGSGKTKILEIASRLAFNAVMTSNSTPSSLFRVIESTSATVLMDEGEMLTSRDDSLEMRLMLNAGYRRNNPVSRTNKDTHQVQWFNVFSPKMIAAINPLDPTLRSRCLTITMVRTANKEKGNKRINDNTANWQGLRNSLYRYSLQCMAEVYEILNHDEEVSVLDCRQNELWLPLLAVSKHLNLYVPATAFEALRVRALFVNEDDESLDDWHKSILFSLRDIVSVAREYTIKEIKVRVATYIEDAEELQKMTSRWIGAALSRFGLKKGRRKEEGNTYLVSPGEIDDLLVRYQLKTAPPEHPEDAEEESGGGDTPQASLSI